MDDIESKNGALDVGRTLHHLLGDTHTRLSVKIGLQTPDLRNLTVADYGQSIEEAVSRGASSSDESITTRTLPVLAI